MVKNKNPSGLDHITKRRKGNKVVYLDKYEEFQDTLKTNSSLAQRHFLKLMKVSKVQIVLG